MKNMLSGEIIRSGAEGIFAVSEKARPLDEFLDSVPTGFRRSVSHLLFCYFRHRRFLDQELDALMERPPRPRVLALLRAAAAQVYFQHAIAPESAVNVAVEEAKREHASGLVNAVLRRLLLRRRPPPESPEEVLPPELLASWRSRMNPEALADAVEVLMTEPPFSFRACRETPPPPGAAELPGWGGFRFFAAEDPAALLESDSFRRGGYYIQDPATSLAPSLPDYTQVGSALELCAAPGGKTLMLAEKLRPGARLVAADRSAKRQEITRRNCELRGVRAEIITAKPEELSMQCDLVVADVPCGNSGVFRRRPDAMWRYSRRSQLELVGLQFRIMESAAELVAPGGQMLYSTCSIEPEENELSVADFLRRHPEFSLLKSRLLLPSPVNDGAFAALLIRR